MKCVVLRFTASHTKHRGLPCKTQLHTHAGIALSRSKAAALIGGNALARLPSAVPTTKSPVGPNMGQSPNDFRAVRLGLVHYPLRRHAAGQLAHCIAVRAVSGRSPKYGRKSGAGRSIPIVHASRSMPHTHTPNTPIHYRPATVFMMTSTVLHLLNTFIHKNESNANLVFQLYSSNRVG